MICSGSKFTQVRRDKVWSKVANEFCILPLCDSNDINAWKIFAWLTAIDFDSPQENSMPFLLWYIETQLFFFFNNHFKFLINEEKWKRG